MNIVRRVALGLSITKNDDKNVSCGREVNTDKGTGIKNRSTETIDLYFRPETT